MSKKKQVPAKVPYRFGATLRRLLLSWLTGVILEYLLLPEALKNLSSLEGLAQMSIVRLLLVTVVLTAVLELAAQSVSTERFERWSIAVLFALYGGLTLFYSFTWPYLVICLLVAIILAVWALLGYDSTPAPAPEKEKKLHPRLAAAVTVCLAAAFIWAVSLWTVGRVRSFSTPTFDFGIFSQMFHNMKESLQPLTTVERDGLLSHFAVHVSPIYYLMLPFYALFPHPETLQILQAAVLASAVIPLWLLGKAHGLGSWQRALLCLVYLAMPALAGGTSYDLHENCFLAPLILYLMLGLDKRSIPLTAAGAVLTLLVKEDAAVYVAIAGLFVLLRAALTHKNRHDMLTGAVLIAGSVLYFLAVTNYLANQGDGVMTYRYKNFIYDGSDSLFTVIKAVLLSPGKMLFECVDKEKLTFIAQTLLPLLVLPLLTRRFDRYILLIPYILLNLMSDYVYQHDIFFQYTFGSTAFLIYLTAVNLSDLKGKLPRCCALALAAVISLGCFYKLIVPKVTYYSQLEGKNRGYYTQLREGLDRIPEGASVSATTFYTTYLSNREILYDIRYGSWEHISSTEYVVLKVNAESDYKKYKTDDLSGYESLCRRLEEAGYRQIYTHGSVFVIYQK